MMKLTKISRESIAVALLATLLWGALPVGADPLPTTTVNLDIPARMQWNQNGGYCGEVCIQQSALYYGEWLSEFYSRQIAYSTQSVNDQIMLDPGSMGKTLNALHLNYVVFPTNTALKPQYRAFIIWMKQQLAQRHLVSFVLFNEDGKRADYDHEIVAVGYSSASDTNTYNPNDLIYFEDHYSDDIHMRAAGEFNDTRSMLGNGAQHFYCIPEDTDYGIAVTGIVDSGNAVPASITLDHLDEPNLIRGQDPITMRATISIRGLTPGASYSLIRYDDYTKVPTSDYTHSSYTSKTDFKAIASTLELTDQFSSKSVVIYRCVPSGD